MGNQPGAIQESETLADGKAIADLLIAANDAASLLLTVNDLKKVDSVLESSLEIIGRAVKADRVHLWRAKHNNDDLSLEIIHSWLNVHGERAPDVLVEVVAPFENYRNWGDRLQRGECIGVSLSNMLPDERNFFNTFGTKTVFFIPLFCANSLWGVISVDDCIQERFFTDDEIITLKSISLMMASVVNYKNTADNLMAINEEANAASKVKNAFLSNMSHEVRTPLNAIVGMAAVGENTSDVDEKDHALRKIRDASSHLLEIISNVLDMARIEEGKLELVPAELVFRDTLDRVMSVIKPLAAEKNQTILTYIDEAIPACVIGDDMRIRQLVSNLLSNAVKFTPIYGKISLEVILKSEADKHIELQLVVSDNGIGISEDQRERVFQAFEQAQGPLNRDYGGTGLGLPISKRIVELMDGNIWVESEPNQGTTVVVTIQLAKCKQSAAEQDGELVVELSDKTDGEQITHGEFKGKRLLIAEDIEINREIMIALLRDSELIIECAEDGQVALNMVMFNVDKYDIVFMDLQMPNLGGLEATRQIRELPQMAGRKRGHLPIIAMTANVLKEDIEACMEAGMDGHLCKPLDIEKVLEVLRRYLLGK